ncbi:hypothetical protein JW905_16785, partial [bacterium]|nr:hypothetical protein [candidate division CSSED10-310 bacterium]
MTARRSRDIGQIKGLGNRTSARRGPKLDTKRLLQGGRGKAGRGGTGRPSRRDRREGKPPVGLLLLAGLAMIIVLVGFLLLSGGEERTAVVIQPSPPPIAPTRVPEPPSLESGIRATCALVEAGGTHWPAVILNPFGLMVSIYD